MGVIHFSEGTSDDDKLCNLQKHRNYLKAPKYYCVYKVFSNLKINIVVTYTAYNSAGCNNKPPYIYAEWNGEIMYGNGHMIYEDDVMLVLPKTPENFKIVQEQYGEHLI